MEPTIKRGYLTTNQIKQRLGDYIYYLVLARISKQEAQKVTDISLINFRALRIYYDNDKGRKTTFEIVFTLPEDRR